MKKPIRFNLQFQNGKEFVQIRNLDDLEENMNINDLLDSFLSGDLERWLRQRNETGRADAIAKLAHDDEEKTLLNLFHVLDLGFPESDIKDTVGRYTHQKVMTQARHIILGSEGKNSKSDQSIQANSPQIKVFNKSRFEDYKQLKEQIKSLHEFKLSAYKPLIDVLLNDYSDYFEIDCINFYYEMYFADCPFAILALLRNPKWNFLFSSLSKEEGVQRRFLSDRAWSTLQLSKEEGVQRRFLSFDSDNRSIYTLLDKNDDILGLKAVYFRPSLFRASYDRPSARFHFWERDYSRLLDEANEFRDNPDKPVKWLDNNENIVSASDWKRLVPKDKKVKRLYCGLNLDIEYDSKAKEEPFIDGYGLLCRRSGWRNCYADNVIIFMLFD